MYEKEKYIKEQRLIEATRKGLTGLEGKLGCILKFLGQPILAHGTGDVTSNPLPDLLGEEEEEFLPELDEDVEFYEVGVLFDGLSSGLHLEVCYNPEMKEIKVTYKGYLVYREVSGDLDCYVPSREWEGHVDYLYGIAKKKEQASNRQRVEEAKEEKMQMKRGLLERLKTRWGM